MKLILSIIFSWTLFLGPLSSDCHLQAAKPITLVGELKPCTQDSISLFVPDGTMIRKVQSFALSKTDSNATFQFTINDVPQPAFFYVGGGQRHDTRMVLLGPDPVVVIRGNYNSLSNAVVAQSLASYHYSQLKNTIQRDQNEFSALINQYRRNAKNPAALPPIVTEMAELDQKKRSRLDSTLGQDPFVGKILALKTYLSFQNHGEGFASEGHYFAQQYFQFVDLTDPDYNRIPHVYEAFLAYAQTLPRVGLTAEQQMQYVDQVLSPLTVGSRTHRMALLGLTYGFRQSANGDAYIRYGEQFIAHYAAQNPAATNQIQSELETQRRLMIGAVAPDIYLPNPEGDSLRLSDLRGKVVLVDFWASWCGPCRRENPNVVRMYNRYQDQGFEIYGVSLDRGKAPWVQAIEKDQLTWFHVCDLRKNRNIAAETYQVSSIPSTFLLDREGRIVAKGLRGQALERKVGELLKIED